MNKKCTLCDKEYPISTEYFGTDKKGVHGLSSRCKTCLKRLREEKKEQKRKYDEQRREKLIELRRKQSKEYYWNNVQKKKEYDKNYRENNKTIIKKRKRSYYLNNKEKVHQRSYIDIQKRRARKQELESTFTLEEWKSCKKHFDYKCAYCGEHKGLEQEHFIALSEGGEYTKANIIPSCRSCNASKLNRDFFEWYPYQEHYSKQREQKILEYLNYESNKTQQLALL